MRPLISVIVPTLNEEKYIKRTLLALKDQDCRNKFEIIVVDSESKDRTVSIARKLADKIVRTKRGVGRARNIGARISKGNILIFIDGDTVVFPNLLSEFSNSLISRGVVGVTCPIFPLEISPKNMILYAFYNVNSLLTLKAKTPHIVGSCVGYRRDTFFKAGGFSEDMHTFEDYVLSEKIIKFGKVVFNQNTVALTSTRRVKKWGALKSIKTYFKHYLEYSLNGKKFNHYEFKPIR